MDLDEWLGDLGLAQYAEIFKATRVAIDTLTDDGLQALGVTAPGDRQRIIAAVRILRTETDPERLRALLVRTLEVHECLAQQLPENTTYLRDVANLFESMGARAEAGDPLQVRAWYAKASALRERVSKLAPNDVTHLLDLSSAYRRLGDLAERTDRAEAREWYAKDIETVQRLAQLEPDNVSHLRYLAASYLWMGQFALRTDLTQALVWYAKDIETVQRLAELDPENIEYVRHLFTSCFRMGVIAEPTAPEQAHTWYAETASHAERLVELAPDNRTYLRDLSYLHFVLGLLASEHGLGDAVGSLEKAIIGYRRVVTKSTEDTDLWEELARACHERAAHAIRQGKADEAWPFQEESIAAVDRAEDLAPGKASTAYLRACILAIAGEELRALTCLNDAVDRGWDATAWAAAERHFEALHNSPRFLELLEKMRRNKEHRSEQTAH